MLHKHELSWNFNFWLPKLPCTVKMERDRKTERVAQAAKGVAIARKKLYRKKKKICFARVWVIENHGRTQETVTLKGEFVSWVFTEKKILNHSTL